MILRLKKSVAFVGMMGAGKTAVGRAVAEKLMTSFLDSDQEIEQAANMSVAEIFARDGEAFFRDREAQVIRRLFENQVCILSTGGGAFMSAEVREIMKKYGHLKRSFKIIPMHLTFLMPYTVWVQFYKKAVNYNLLKERGLI
ncbi:MAG: hypothetical protein EBV97_17920, partial [Rhodobacteraceae bacterium]|nr:hypothetical protein [Paracoccaceae bacterium]